MSTEPTGTDQLTPHRGRVALVTGASSGIGRATALLLARHGADVVITAPEVERSGLEQTAADCAGLAGAVLPVTEDLLDETAPARLVEAARTWRGRLDYVVNNAFYEAPGPVAETTIEGWDATLRVSLTAAMLIIREALPLLIDSGAGSIVNLSSQRAVASAPGATAYEAAKAGITALTRSVAIDYGPSGVRCNCVSPGMVESERVRAWLDSDPGHRAAAAVAIPLTRPGRPEEVASVIDFVLGPGASFLTGATIAVDGGQAAGLPENSALRIALATGYR